MTIAVVAASDRRTEVYRLTSYGRLEHRWLDTSRPEHGWTEWQRAPFEGTAVAVAAISGWDEQVEIFVLDAEGQVWNRWWWHDRGWQPKGGFNPLGAPFPFRARALSALSAGNGHFNVFVESADGELAVLPHVNGADGYYWRRSCGPDALNDGWWPTFAPSSKDAFRRP
jgi:hypothetical protein